MKAISRAIDEIINDKLRHAPGKITRMIDESDGFVSIFYNMIEHLNEEELEIISEQYTMLLRKQLRSQKDTRKMYQLERQLKLKYKRTTICSKIQPMLNQTAQTLFETVKQAESGWNGRRVDFMMSDNGANVIAVAKPTMLNVTLITCCGHNLNLVYKHFITCYKDFERHVGKVVRKLRSDWKSLRWLVTILKFDFQFVENYFNSQDGTIIIDDDLNNFNDVMKPPLPVSTRWQSVSRAAVFILDHLEPIYRAAIEWGIDKRDENIQATWSDVLDILENEDFLEDLQVNKIFYEQFLEPSFKELRTNNTMEFLLEYINSWKIRLEQLQAPDNVDHTLFNRARGEGVKELEKIMGDYEDYSFTYASALLHSQLSRMAARKLFEFSQDERSKWGFSDRLLTSIQNGTHTLIDSPDALKRWVENFGSIELDNEKVESGFSYFNLDTIANRKDREAYLKIILNDIDLWYHELNNNNSRYFSIYKDTVTDINTEDRTSRPKVATYAQALTNIRSEIKRRQQDEQRFDNEECINAILYLFRAYNALHIGDAFETVNIGTSSNRWLTTQNLQNILEFLVSKNYLEYNDIAPNSPGLAGVIYVFTNPKVRQAIGLFVEQQVLSNFTEFAPTSQQHIRLQSIQAGVAVGNLLPEEDNMSTHTNFSTHQDHSMDMFDDRLIILSQPRTARVTTSGRVLSETSFARSCRFISYTVRSTETQQNHSQQQRTTIRNSLQQHANTYHQSQASNISESPTSHNSQLQTIDNKSQQQTINSNSQQYSTISYNSQFQCNGGHDDDGWPLFYSQGFMHQPRDSQVFHWEL
ncbi:hypothetical protein FDP41_000712 [Naegleria fowleri]|uniref:DUF659 domain-containing protein n=1 Tax=Naegleria fowleri TaxID=5763 RepID=A0A6A5C334_NAEFO|nr:uncharacterized protein FDP41_000712 [Naegleria fowleri]KAF0984813.1 hypothetical protein FDP41_000712 [Naegleria fowleri]